MKHRVRLDLSFSKESDAKSLMAYAKKLQGKAVSINEGLDNEEISNIDYHLCFHDEKKNRPCESIERVEVRKIKE